MKCGAGEGWRSAEPIVWEMKCYEQSTRTGISCKH